jgi:hypothetical protein
LPAWTMRAPIVRAIWVCWSFELLSGSQPSAWVWAWSWDPLRFARRHPPHDLSPARAKRPAGQDPKARLSRPKSRQQRSDQARKPVNSEQDSCSLVPISEVFVAPVHNESEAPIHSDKCLLFGLSRCPVLRDAGSAGGGQAVVADQPAGKTREDRRQGRAPGRYVIFQMAEVAVPRELFQEILRLIDGLRPRPVPA